MTGKVSFNAFQNMMAYIWQPGKEMYAKELEHNHYLFQFYSEVGIQRVMMVALGHMIRKQFVFERTTDGINPSTNNSAESAWYVGAGVGAWFAINVHDIASVEGGRRYIGQFVVSDPNNFIGVRKVNLCVRVTIDVTKLFKRRTKIRRDDSN